MNTEEQLQQAVDALIKFTEDDYSKKTAIHINDLVRKLREEKSVLVVKLEDVNNYLKDTLEFGIDLDTLNARVNGMRHIKL